MPSRYSPSGEGTVTIFDGVNEVRARVIFLRTRSEAFPSIVSSILSWSNETHFNMSHGSPEAALIAIGSYMTQSVLAVGVAI